MRLSVATRPVRRLVCVGGAHRDLVARTADAFERGTSCPGAIAETAGGVARNVAVLVASAGIPVTFIGRVGDDAAGRSVAEGLSKAGVEARLAVDPAAATGTYLAVHDRTGELVAAVSDLAIYDRLTPDGLPAEMFVDPDALVFADANLPDVTLRHLAERLGPRLAVDAISRAKAPRLSPLIAGDALLFLNLPSAEALAASAFADAPAAAARLAAAGARSAVITAGPGPVAVLDGGAVTEVPVAAAAVVDVTGAGDALAAATLAGLMRGAPLVEAVALGVAASAAALSVAGALDQLPPAIVTALARPEGSPS